MFESKNSFPLFPTILWSFKIPGEVANRINSQLRIKLDQLIARSPDKDHTTFLQTEHDFHTLPEMQELKGYFMDAVNEVISILATKCKDVEITGCWANIHPADAVHRSHSHPNNFLSAVYYVTVPRDDLQQITFYDPRIQHYILTPAVERSNAHNSEHVFFDVEEGLLLLFPAWLVHSVPASLSKARRVSVSFNINFKDFSGQVSPPMWQANVPTHPRTA